MRSAGQGAERLRDRLRFLREQGSRCTLLIDPERQCVEVVDGDREWVAEADGEVVLESLNGFSFKVRELFR